MGKFDKNKQKNWLESENGHMQETEKEIGEAPGNSSIYISYGCYKHLLYAAKQ